MRILKVWDSEYPWDVRTEKVCRALTDLGHDVHMVARNRKGRPLREELAECTVHRMAPWRLLGGHLDAASQFPAFFNPRWTRLMMRVGQAHSVDLIMVRDLPLALPAIRVGRRLRVPVVLDMAENYPAMIKDLWTTGTTRFGDVLVRNPGAVEWVEERVLRRIDHVLVVVEESRDRLLSLGVPSDRVTVVSNTPSLARVEEYASLGASLRAEGRGGPGAEARGEGPGGLRLVYLGLMEEARGVEKVIEALGLLQGSGLAFRLDLIGDGRSLEVFRERTQALGLSSSVRFHGFVPYQDALRQVARADVGLIPHFANESWETTIPNKLFDYMSLGLPVVASDVTPVRRVLEETGAGRTFRDRDAEDLAGVLAELAAAPELRDMGEAGRRAVRDRYNWEEEVRRLEGALASVR